MEQALHHLMISEHAKTPDTLSATGFRQWSETAPFCIRETRSVWSRRPEEAAELLEITHRLIETQSDYEDEEEDPVDTWVNADRRVQLEHDVESYHDGEVAHMGDD